MSESEHLKNDGKPISQWRVLALIEDAGSAGIALYDVASRLGVDRHDLRLTIPLEQLQRQRRINMAIGKSSDGHVCQVATILIPRRASKGEKDSDEEKT